MKTGVAVLVIALALASQLARAAGCVVENDIVGVIGALSRQTFAGPPNYESVDRGDQAETVWILTVREPIAFCALGAAEGKSHPVGSVSRFQLVLNEQQRGLPQSLIARYALVRGRIFLGHTGHHHTAALIEVTDVRPATQSSLSIR
jgi:hypothetical protein